MPVSHPLLNSRTIQVFRRLELLAHSVIEGFSTGMHKSPFKGFAIEFAEHREYAPGDDLRHLDWKAFGKLNRYYVKQYEEETSMRAHIVLDTSGSMGYGAADRSKLDLGRYIAAVLAYLLLQQQDSVGLVTCASAIGTYLPPRTTRTHYKRIIDTVTAVRPEGETRLGDVLHALARRLRRRALIVIVSDLFDDPEALRVALNHFAHKKHEVVVFRVLDRRETTFEFRDPTRFEGLEFEPFEEVDPLQIRREYLKAFEAHRDRIRQTCFERRIDFCELYTDEPFERSLARYLVERMRRKR